MRIILTFVALLFACNTYSQWQDGYLVPKDSEDTLQGMIFKDERFIHFKVGRFASAVKYKHKKVKAFSLHGREFRWECFEVQQNQFPERKCAFLEIVVQGEMTLFEYEGKGLYNPRKYTNYYLTRNGTTEIIHVHRDKFSFRREMGYYFQECPDLLQQIEDKVLGIDDISEMVLHFNAYWSTLPKEEMNEEQQ